MVVTKFGDLGPAVLQLVLVIAGDPFTKGEDGFEVVQQLLGLSIIHVASKDIINMDAKERQKSRWISAIFWWRMYWTVIGQEEAGIKWMLHYGSIAHVEDPCCCFLVPGSWSIT